MKWLNAKSLIFVLFIAFPLFAQIRIGYIDSDKIRSEYKEFSDAQAQFDKEVANWEAQAESLKTALLALQDEYEKQSLLLSEEKKKELEMRIKDKKDEYEGFLADIFSDKGKAQRKNAELTRPLLDKINQALHNLAEEEHIDVIFDIAGGGVAYARPELDLTDKLIEKLNK